MPLASELVQSCTSVFTLAELHARAQDVVDDPNSSMDDHINVLKLDPILSARLLRVSNSPSYGASKQVDSITRAVSLIGVQAVRDLVTATTIGQTFSGMPPQFMDATRFWRKSLFCALIAEKIAISCGIDNTEGYYVEGLLRDIGHFVLYQTVPQRAQSALIEAGYLEASLAEVEQSNIGCDFAEVGAELIRFWEMPVHLEQAIRCQLSPKDAGEFAVHASIVHMAGVVVDHEELASNRCREILPFHPTALSATQFDPSNIPALCKEVYDELHRILSRICPQALAA